MIKQQIAKDCPHSRKANGVIFMSPEIVAGLAGAVQDPDEWAIVLQGIRSEDAYEITVTGWRLPEQERTAGHVDLGKDVLQTPFSNPPGNDVCVVHSHGASGARFSGLDKSSLNTRYPASIVVAWEKGKGLLGFDYQAVGKVQLPCGGRGEIAFKIQPMTGPEMAKVVRVTHNEKDLGDCVRAEDVSKDPWKVQWKGACGLLEPNVATKNAAFGVGTEILDVVSQLPREKDRRQQSVGFQRWQGGQQHSNDQPTTIRKEAVGWECPKDKGKLFWSIVEKSKMYCEKCNVYYVEPEKETTETKVDDADNNDMTWCESCEMSVADGPAGFECGLCEAGFCISCGTYHDGQCVGSDKRMRLA